MKLLLALFAVVSFSSTSWATIVFNPGLSYSSTDLDNGTTTSESTEVDLDLKLGYIFPMGMYVGGLYQSESGSVTGGNDSKGFTFGPTVGYYSPTGFYAMLSYFLIGERDDGANGGDVLSEVSGPQIDLGWVFPLAANFSMGPQLTYRSVNYKKLENGGTTTDVDRTRTEIRPYLSFWFMF